MGRFFHKLKPCKTTERPRQYCYFDCEANREHHPDGSETQTLRLGVANYHRLPRKNNPEVSEIWRFDTPYDFWARLFEHAEPDRTLVVIAYNVRYDVRIVNTFNILKELGFTQRSLYYKGESTVLVFKRDKMKLVIIDAMNYVSGKLSYWGEKLGLPKLDIDLDTDDDAELEIYCRRDVEIVRGIVRLWFNFIDENKLGSFACTRAAQAFNAFRHRYMDNDIFIHADRRATKLERDGYAGGRTEAFFLGKLEGHRFYKLDVNSMYPFLMTKTLVPTKLLGTLHAPGLDRLLRWSAKGCITADVTINTTEPCYPLKRNGALHFPIGRFRTTLSTPELAHALKLGRVERCHMAAFYHGHIMFKRYIDDMYALRKRYVAEGNKNFGDMVKIMMNSLYGKLGAVSETMTSEDNELNEEDGEHYIIDGAKNKLSRYVIIAGERWDFGDVTEWIHSAPGIAAHITSASRLYLWQLIKQAGRKNVYYCDTDSIMTTSVGYRRLFNKIDSGRLGLLKMEEWSYTGEIRGLKDYTFGADVKIKGVRANAEELRPGVYRQDQWQGLAGAIRDGVHDRVIIRPMTKMLTRIYSKGSVSSSGWISPFKLTGS